MITGIGSGILRLRLPIASTWLTLPVAREYKTDNLFSVSFTNDERSCCTKSLVFYSPLFKPVIKYCLTTDELCYLMGAGYWFWCCYTSHCGFLARSLSIAASSETGASSISINSAYCSSLKLNTRRSRITFSAACHAISRMKSVRDLWRISAAASISALCDSLALRLSCTSDFMSALLVYRLLYKHTIWILYSKSYTVFYVQCTYERVNLQLLGKALPLNYFPCSGLPNQTQRPEFTACDACWQSHPDNLHENYGLLSGLTSGKVTDEKVVFGSSAIVLWWDRLLIQITFVS
nr:hypothetical protein [uncultured bacterium]